MTLTSITVLALLIAATLLGTCGCAAIQRALLFYPTHRPHEGALTPWTRSGEVIGYARAVESPGAVWLMLHGNAGQASDRLGALPCFSPGDSVYILEYPGYGDRPGVPSREAFDRAAREAYALLRETHPRHPVCVAAESIGSGPAAALAREIRPPDKFALIVPFDRLSSVAADHFPAWLVRLVLRDDWDNMEALSRFTGPVEIVGAEADTVVPVRHARALAAAVPGSRLTVIPGDHNDWCGEGRVRIRYP
jgi:pimeloyl-ACP methyl ester carboxylesterase